MRNGPRQVITVTLNPALDKTLEVPGFRVGEHARAQVRAVVPAGKGVNVARGLARLGGRAAACGLVGRDELPIFEQSLRADGVEALFCPVVGRTRTNTTILDPEARTTTHLREPGFSVGPGDMQALCQALAGRLAGRPAAVVVFSGSLPMGMMPRDLAALIRACAGLRAQVVVDTNGPALRAALDAGAVDTVKPNLTELGECLGRAVARAEAAAAAEALLDRVKTVLLTLGAEGAYLVRRGVRIGLRCPVVEKDLRNTVGCGDAFLAGWLHGLEVCESPADALRWAVAAGAASATAETTAWYGRADAEALLARCEPVG